MGWFVVGRCVSARERACTTLAPRLDQDVLPRAIAPSA
jgi:hypothetical protein